MLERITTFLRTRVCPALHYLQASSHRVRTGDQWGWILLLLLLKTAIWADRMMASLPLIQRTHFCSADRSVPATSMHNVRWSTKWMKLSVLDPMQCSLTSDHKTCSVGRMLDKEMSVGQAHGIFRSTPAAPTLSVSIRTPAAISAIG